MNLRQTKVFKIISGWRWKIHLFKDWWGTKVWTKTKEVVTPLGFKLTSGFHPAYKQMRTGKFEVEETSAILKLLPKSDIFIDVGANLGYYTCLALQHGKPVLAFEPQQQNTQCLYRNLIANQWQDRVEVYPVALGEKPGLLTLYGASGPSASLIKNWAGYSSRFNQIVSVLRLDDILGERFQKERLFIKIDVEGAESLVLAGAHRTIMREPKPIWLLEVCLHEFHPEGTNPDYKTIFELFWKNGYRAYTAMQSPRLVTADDVNIWVTQGFSESRTFNYIFTDLHVLSDAGT